MFEKRKTAEQVELFPEGKALEALGGCRLGRPQLSSWVTFLLRPILKHTDNEGGEAR